MTSYTTRYKSLSLKQFEDKIEKFRKGCGFKNFNKDVCGKTPTPNSKFSRDHFLCSGCRFHISQYSYFKKKYYPKERENGDTI